jgi:hypothetical protein
MNSSVGPEILANLRSDAEHSSEIALRDIRALKEVSQKYRMDFFAFTNSMTLRAEYLFVDGRSGQSQVRPFNLGELPADTVLKNSPLSRAVVLQSALEAVLSEDANATTDVFLIVNTHGTADIALIPRVAANFEVADPGRVLAELGDEPHDMSLPLPISGTRKTAFWHAISVVSERFPVRFPLLFIESCEGAPYKWDELLAIPASVSVIAHSGFDGIKPAEIDFGALLRTTSEDVAGFNRSYAAELVKTGVHVEPRWLIWIWPLRVTLQQIPVFWFFVPMALWLSGMALLLIRRYHFN